MNSYRGTLKGNAVEITSLKNIRGMTSHEVSFVQMMVIMYSMHWFNLFELQYYLVL